jgi:hypothetical protein
MSACLQRFQRRSQRANRPGLHEPGRPDRKGLGPRWTVLSAAGSAPAGSANGLAGSVSGTGKTARRCGSSWPPRSPPGLLARLPGIQVMVTSAWLYAFAGTGPARPPMSAAGCNTGRMPGLPEPGIPASAADASDVFPGMPGTGSEVEYDIAPGRSSSTGRPDARALAANGRGSPINPAPLHPATRT